MCLAVFFFGLVILEVARGVAAFCANHVTGHTKRGEVAGVEVVMVLFSDSCRAGDSGAGVVCAASRCRGSLGRI